MPELDDIPDYRLVEAIEGLVRVYDNMKRGDDCVRLTVREAGRLAELARLGLYR